MPNLTVRFVRPASLIGQIITWKLKEPYSHAVLILDGIAYSSTFPVVAMYPLSHKSVAMPPREGVDLHIPVTEDELTLVRSWCNSQIGKLYDFVALLGWMSGTNKIQSINRTYCFEFCRQPLVILGLLPKTRELIKGDRLYQEVTSIIKAREELIQPAQRTGRRTKSSSRFRLPIPLFLRGQQS